MMPSEEEYMRRRQPGAAPLPPSPSDALSSSPGGVYDYRSSPQYQLQQQIANNQRRSRMAQYGLDPSTTDPSAFDQWWDSNLRNMGGVPLQGGTFFSHQGDNPQLAQHDPWMAFGGQPSQRRTSAPVISLMNRRRSAYGGY